MVYSRRFSGDRNIYYQNPDPLIHLTPSKIHFQRIKTTQTPLHLQSRGVQNMPNYLDRMVPMFKYGMPDR